MENRDRIQEDVNVGDIRDAQMGPMIQVVLDADEDPIIFPFSDMGVEAGDPGMIADDDLIALAEDWLRLERGIDLAPGELRGWKVGRPQTGNCTISKPAVFGVRTTRKHCPRCGKKTLHQEFKGWWECTVCGRWNGRAS